MSLFWIAIYLKPIRNDIAIVSSIIPQLKSACLAWIKVGAVHKSKVTSNYYAGGVVKSSYRTDILDTTAMIVPHQANNPVTTITGVIEAAIIKDDQIGQRLAIRVVSWNFELVV